MCIYVSDQTKCELFSLRFHFKMLLISVHQGQEFLLNNPVCNLVLSVRFGVVLFFITFLLNLNVWNLFSLKVNLIKFVDVFY